MRVGAEGGGASPWSAEGASTLTGALGMSSARGVGGGREHAMEANAAGVGATGRLPANPGMDAFNQMQPRRGNQRGESLHELPG
jgi:hypothetical protein